MSKPIKYCELSVGDVFTLNCDYTEDIRNGKIHKIKGDKRLFRKDAEGATEIRDMYGNPNDWKVYPYLTMPVYRFGGEAE